MHHVRRTKMVAGKSESIVKCIMQVSLREGIRKDQAVKTMANTNTIDTKCKIQHFSMGMLKLELGLNVFFHSKFWQQWRYCRLKRNTKLPFHLILSTFFDY